VASPASETARLAARLATLLRVLLAVTVAIVVSGVVLKVLRGRDDWLHAGGVALLVTTPFLATLTVAIAAVRTHPRLTVFAAATLVLVALGVWIA
jgi:hypothetical protein